MVILMCQISEIKCPNFTIIILRAKLAVIPGNIFCQNTAWNASRLLNAENVDLKSCIRDSNLCSSTLYVRYSLCHNQCGDYWPETTSNDLLSRYILLINCVSLCPFYQQSNPPLKRTKKYAKFHLITEKTHQKHQFENFVKKYCSFSTCISKSSRENNV